MSEVDMGKWRGLFEWTMKHQEDSHSGPINPADFTPERREWLKKALSEAMKDFADRMKEIKDVLDTGGAPAGQPGADLKEKEELMDELVEIVENIDYAKDLHKIGGLQTLLSLMSHPAPSLRWRAAEVAATCMANNPPVQRWFLEGGALPPLVAMMGDTSPTCQAKSLLALSAMVRHFQPGLEAFRLGGGVFRLWQLIHTSAQTMAAAAAVQQQKQEGTAEVTDGGDEQQQEQQLQQQGRTCRKALTLLHYVCQAHPSDCEALVQYGAVGTLSGLLLDETDSALREAVLQVLLEVVSHPTGWQHVKADAPGLQQQLQGLQEQLQGLEGEAQEAEEESRGLVKQLLGLVGSSEGPTDVKAGKQDHVDVDLYMDGTGSGGNNKAIALNSEQQQQQQQQQLQGAESSEAHASGLAIMVVPKQDMR